MLKRIILLSPQVDLYSIECMSWRGVNMFQKLALILQGGGLPFSFFGRVSFSLQNSS